MKCFILAAGYGKRMGELTLDIPKPLLKVAGIPMLDYSLFFAYSLGITEFIINTHYYSSKIHNELQKFPFLNIHFSDEPTILGTGGGLRKGIEGFVEPEETILLLNPDTICFPNSKFILPETLSGDIFLYLKEKPAGATHTGLILDNTNVFFASSQEENQYTYIGVSLVKAKVIYDSIPLGVFYDLSDLFKTLSVKRNLAGGVFEGTVYDCGEKEKYLSLPADEIKETLHRLNFTEFSKQIIIF
jgi:N-acetyl-alpha-D-muramate 1-phosphate uridylyltransferase